ncbi:MAG: carbohydrate ABC transporter permease [Tyzzerella sp.]|nr:carbohydrate ABC transporter permease [Tyzzerella sp.]
MSIRKNNVKGNRSGLNARRVNRSTGGSIVLLIVLLIFAAFMVLPIVLAISNSLKPLNELWEFPPKLYAKEPTLKNYADMFNIMSGSLVPFTRYIFNTVMITVLGTAGNLLFSAMCAYPLAKKKFPGNRLIFKIIEMTLMFNMTVTAIPSYIIMKQLGWIDKYYALIVSTFASTLGLYLIKQFMETSVPDTLIEAASIDGATQWQTFWQIVIPCVKPAILTQVLLSVQSLWNTGASNYIFSDEKKTLSYALSQIVAGGVSRAGVGAAVAVFMMVVPITIFILCQGNIMDTMSTSGMKD